MEEIAELIRRNGVTYPSWGTISTEYGVDGYDGMPVRIDRPADDAGASYRDYVWVTPLVDRPSHHTSDPRKSFLIHPRYIENITTTEPTNDSKGDTNVTGTATFTPEDFSEGDVLELRHPFNYVTIIGENESNLSRQGVRTVVVNRYNGKIIDSDGNLNVCAPDGSEAGSLVHLKYVIRKNEAKEEEATVWSTIDAPTPIHQDEINDLRDSVAELTHATARLETDLRIAHDTLSAAGDNHEKFKREVAEKAMELAEEHDWCDVVTDALKALGLEDYIPAKKDIVVTLRLPAAEWFTGVKPESVTERDVAGVLYRAYVGRADLASYIEEIETEDAE